MSKSDQWVNIILIGLILLYLSVWVIGYFTHRFAHLASIANLVTGCAIVGYWVIRQMQISEHILDSREMLVLLFEVGVIFCAVLYLLNPQRASWLKIAQYIFYGIHLVVLVLGLLFMLTFKMNKLF